MKQIGLLLIILSLVYGCASTLKTKDSDNIDTATLESLVNNKSFEIESQWARPIASNALLQLGTSGIFPPGSNSGNINLIGNANFLKLNDSVAKAYLPFYGERRMGSNLGSTQVGIEFDENYHNYEVKKGKKDSYEIRFEVNDKNNPSESYIVQITLFPNLTSVVNINSSHRSFIQYRGKASNIKLTDEL